MAGSEKRFPLMCHWVLGYPDEERSLSVIKSFIRAEMAILELQIPFSDPSADGEVITRANHAAVQGGMTTGRSLSMLSQLSQEFPAQEIYLMSYANKIFCLDRRVLKEFVRNTGIRNFIVPDLPFDSELALEIASSCGICFIPVISANLSKERIHQVAQTKAPFIYLMSSYNITGSDYAIHRNLSDVVKQLKSACEAKIGIGFGVTTPAQVHDVLKLADYAIVGSAWIRAFEEGVIEERLSEMVSGF